MGKETVLFGKHGEITVSTAENGYVIKTPGAWWVAYTEHEAIEIVRQLMTNTMPTKKHVAVG